MARNVRQPGPGVEMVQRSSLEDIRTALVHLRARRFAAALEAARPLAEDAQGRLVYALALAGSGAVDEAAPNRGTARS
jgi:hypothetical protein